MKPLFAILRNAGLRFSADGCAFLAQAIAFNALFAMFPLLLLTITAFGFFYGTAEAQANATDLIKNLAPELQAIITDNLHSAVKVRGLSGIIGIIALIWSGKNLFMTLAFALNRALGISEDRGLIKEIAISIVMLPLVGSILLVATAMPLVLSYLIRLRHFHWLEHFPEVAGYGGAIVLVFVVAAILYSILPNARVGWRFALPGATFTALGWAVVQVAFAVYATHTNFLVAYGAVSGILALLFWFYLMGTIFLFGAELCAEWVGEKALPGRRTVRSG